MSTVLFEPPRVEEALRKMATEIALRGRTEPLVLVAIRRGGEPLVGRIAAHLRAHSSELSFVLGAVDVTWYRDDAATLLPSPVIGPTELPTSVEGRRVILVDDVLHTGRTVRAALDAVLDFGRPSVIELAVLIDRGGRELPIAADYVGAEVDVPSGARVEVFQKRVSPDRDELWVIRVAANKSTEKRT